MAKPFASTADTGEQRPKMVELGPDVYGYLSDHDPNTGVIIGPESCTVIDCRATPTLARQFLEDIRALTDKPVTTIFLTHYHAVRVFGAPAFGPARIIASRRTRALIEERGEADKISERGRFPRLFRGGDPLEGLTWPSLTFERQMSQWLGPREVQFHWLGRGHTAGDAVCFVPDCGVLFSGDLVDFHSTSYAGDAYIGEWIQTLEALRALGATTLVPGRGRAAAGPAEVNAAIDQTIGLLSTLLGSVQAEVARGADSLEAVFAAVYPGLQARYGSWPLFDHCITFGISRAFDEARGLTDPRVWTDARDKELWDAVHG